MNIYFYQTKKNSCIKQKLDYNIKTRIQKKKICVIEFVRFGFASQRRIYTYFRIKNSQIKIFVIKLDLISYIKCLKIQYKLSCCGINNLEFLMYFNHYNIAQIWPKVHYEYF